jgi:hypothetical protein
MRSLQPRPEVLPAPESPASMDRSLLGSDLVEKATRLRKRGSGGEWGEQTVTRPPPQALNPILQIA